MSENKKNDFLASFNRDFWASKPFLRAPCVRNNRFQWSISCLSSKSSTISKSKQLLWGGDPPERMGLCQNRAGRTFSRAQNPANMLF